MAACITQFGRDFGDRAGNGFVIHAGPMTLPMGGGTTALPIAAL